jgi:hypothetical protein
MGLLEMILPPALAAPRAPAVLLRRQASEQELAALNAEIGERALAAIEGKAGGKENLAALHDRIRAVTFEIECNAAAHELALLLDQEAVDDWRDSVRAMPVEEIVAGISTTECCRLCSPETGCVISGLECAHPKNGALNRRYQGNSGVRRVYVAACKQLEEDFS